MKKIKLFIILLLAAVFSHAQLTINSIEKVNPLSTSFYFSGAAHDGEVYYAEVSSRFDIGSVATFNGINWTPITTRNSGIASEIVTDIFEHNGVFYFATDEGLSVKDGAIWTSINTNNSNLATNICNSVFVNDEAIVVCTQDGISYKLTTANNWVNIDNTTLGKYKLRFAQLYTKPHFFKGKIYYDGRINNQQYACTYDVRTNEIAPIRVSNRSQFVTRNGEVIGMHRDSGLYIADSVGTLLSGTDYCQKFEAQNYYSLFSDNNKALFYVGYSYNGTEKISLGIVNNGEVFNGREDFGLFEITDFAKTLTFMDSKTKTIYIPLQGKSFSSEDYIEAISKPADGLDILDVNNISEPITNLGLIGLDMVDLNFQEEAPKGSCKRVNFVSSLWIGGKSEDSTVHLAAMTYRQRGQDFWPGPLNEVDGSFHGPHEEEYDRVWKVSKSEIQQHISLAKSGSVSESQTTDAIWNWPANGANGAAKQLAPFIDLNANGIYEPEDGEYPDIQGDQCIFWIMNDAAHSHTETGGQSLGVEIHGMAYAYNCQNGDPASESTVNTIFYKYRIINRSEHDYHDMVVGRWKDIDIGNYADDYVGCYVTQNFGYGYNGDDLDEGLRGYGARPPMTASLILDAPTKIDDGIDGDGDGIIDEADEKRMMGTFVYYNNDANQINGNPVTDSDFYGYITGKWKTGADIEHGGDGNRGTNGVKTNYMFGAETNPENPTNWTETIAGNLPSDRRFVTGTYKFDLDAGEEATVEYANIFSRDMSQNDQLPQMLEYVNYIKSWYFSTGKPECFNAVGILDKEIQSAEIFPNPTNGALTIKTTDNIEGAKVLNLAGQLVLEQASVSVNSLDINISALPAGIYIVETKTETGTLKNKVVKF